MYYMDYLARQAGYESYDHYMRSEHWQVFSNGIRASKCFVCGYGAKLQVHHHTYERLGEELPTDVVTVCERCHVKIHFLVKNKKATLSNAHRILVANTNKDKAWGYSNKKWVYWKNLCNISLKETPEQVIRFLRGQGLMKQDGVDPTDKAIRHRWVRARKDTYEWNKTRYLNETRRIRRAERDLLGLSAASEIRK